MNFEDLPKITNFSLLEPKDKVYSKKFGYGEVLRPYGDNEAIIGFIGGIRRVSDDDSDLQIFPEDLTKKKRTTSSIMINGVKMGRRKMVKYMKDQQKLSEMK